MTIRESHDDIKEDFDKVTKEVKLFIARYQIRSNQIYLPAQNIKEKQLKNIRLTHTKINDIQAMNASRTQRQRDCSYMSPKE